jgi:hypothetical protein
MGRARDLANILSSSGNVALDSELALSLITPTSIAATGGSATISTTGAVSFTSASAISLNDVFSATYLNYKILITYTSAPGVATRLRWRVAGSDNSGTDYNYTVFRSNMFDGTTSSWTQTADGNTFHNIGETSSGEASASNIDVFQPFATAKTTYVQSSVRLGSFYGGAGYFNATTSFTGFSIVPSSGTMTGTLSVYGYRN